MRYPVTAGTRAVRGGRSRAWGGRQEGAEELGARGKKLCDMKLPRAGAQEGAPFALAQVRASEKMEDDVFPCAAVGRVWP